MSTAAAAIQPPSSLLMLLEARALHEFGAFVGALPLLSRAPRGDGHPVLVLPGLLASDRSTAPLRKFLTNRGNAWQSKGELDKAIADYDKAIKADPTDADAWNNRGAAWRGKGDIDKAMADYREALRINPKFDTAQENLEALRLLKAKKGR